MSAPSLAARLLADWRDVATDGRNSRALGMAVEPLGVSTTEGRAQRRGAKPRRVHAVSRDRPAGRAWELMRVNVRLRV